MINTIKGFKDILPSEINAWQHVENTAAKIFRDFGYKEIRIPILERTQLFKRSIGEKTDIVEKEMYTFSDRNKDMLTLRPEATASVVRAYIQNQLYAKDPIQKLYTIGPMFRRERPQKGRYRQFYQINAEVFGISAPFIDAEIIFMLTTLFKQLSITNIKANINTLGCSKCRPNFKKTLIEFLTSKIEKLCVDCNRRLKQNPLRVLDCKISTCQESIINAPTILDFICDDCKDHFDTLQEQLNKLSVEYIINSRLVRGLDYYNRTAFEIQTTHLGAQNAVAGGGRYDGLVKLLEGPDQPAIGFAIGFDRLIALINSNELNKPDKIELFIAALGKQAIAEAFSWLCSLKSKGINADMNYEEKSLKSLMKRADKLNASSVLIVGEQELTNQKAILRNMTTKNQEEILIKNLAENILKKI